MKLKNFITPICGLALTLLTTTSCSWFDVNPKTDVKAEDLFSTPDGFESALAGIYVASTERQAYGENWTFGFMDKLTQSYDNIPQDESASTIYNYTRDGGSKDVLATMWQQSYFLIANANNLLRWLDKQGESVITNTEKRRMIRGEALAWRAYLHFDLLRAWGPIYKKDPKAKSIPYRKAADNSKKPLLPADSVGNLILADIDSALVQMEYERDQSLAGSSRRFRLNYWAIMALKARVNLYLGNKEEAAQCAREVIDNSGLLLATTNNGDPAFTTETLFGINIYQMDENYSDAFARGPEFGDHYYLRSNKFDQIFDRNGEGLNDIRCRDYAFYIYSDQQVAITRKYQTAVNNLYMIPLIRLPEMYYILCESLPLEESAQYISQVMEYRGLLGYQNFTSDQAREAALEKEYRKEFYAEGQYFFFLKAHGMENFILRPTDIEKMTETQYVFPLPDAEKEYGWTEEEAPENNSSETPSEN